MPYSERAFFDGDHCQHCADRDEHKRLERARDNARRMVDRRRGPRSIFASQPLPNLV